MKLIFTLCSNNYLAHARVLCNSVNLHQAGWKFILGLVDQKDESIDYSAINGDVIEVAQVESGIINLAEKFSIVELNTCVKPAFFQYLFEKYDAEQVIYLDPDTCLYSRMEEVDNQLADQDFILTPHILSPISIDEKTPTEPLFLNYGLYNLGFLSLKSTRQTREFLQWWKERTYRYGFDKPAHGLFTDQLWINLVPVYYDRVQILRHAGYNMAPWNLHERFLSAGNDSYYVNSSIQLVFYHFSGYDPEKQKFHKDYTRFSMMERPDLHKLYEDYRIQLETEGHKQCRKIPCFYTGIRNKMINLEQENKVHRKLPYHLRIIKEVKRLTPAQIKRFALKIIKI